MLIFTILTACSSNPSSNSNTENANNSNESTGETIDLTWYYPVNVGGAITKVIDNYAEEFQ